MTRKDDLLIHSVSSEKNGLKFFEHDVGYFEARIDKDLTRLLTEFIHLLTLPRERHLIGLRPFDEKQWRSISTADWTTLIDRPEESEGRKVSKPRWVIGCAHSPEKLAEVYRFGWNYNNNDPFVVAIAPEPDEGVFFAEAENRGEFWPGHEEILLECYPTVLSRYLDGLWVRILSNRVGPEEIMGLLQKAAQSTVAVRILRTDSAVWPSPSQAHRGRKSSFFSRFLRKD